MLSYFNFLYPFYHQILNDVRNVDITKPTNWPHIPYIFFQVKLFTKECGISNIFSLYRNHSFRLVRKKSIVLSTTHLILYKFFEKINNRNYNNEITEISLIFHFFFRLKLRPFGYVDLYREAVKHHPPPLQPPTSTTSFAYSLKRDLFKAFLCKVLEGQKSSQFQNNGL